VNSVPETMTATTNHRLRAVKPRRTTPGWWRDACGLVAGGSLLVVVALWVQNRGVQLLSTGPAGLLTTTGRLTGLLAADLLLVQVVLMARIPFVERSYGQDELARRHRLVGFTSFNLMVAHIVLIGLGYAASDRKGVVREVWDLVWTYPGMLLATAGTAALVMVVVTSVRLARARLRYESWHLLHLYAYLGVGLALPHQLWTGADFLASPAATVYWWGAYIAAAGSVVVFRAGLPLWRTLWHRPVVSAVVPEAAGVISVHISGRRLRRLPLRAGQFFVWRFLDGPGWTRGHPYSLSAAPSPDGLRITVKDLGDGSRRIAELRPGTRVALEGPYGRLTADSRTRPKVTMLASGIGVTPLRALLEELPYAPGEATLVYRAGREADFLFRAELAALAARRGVRIFYVPGHRVIGRESWMPHRAAALSDEEGLLQLVPDLRDHDVFVCGPDAWIDAAVAAAHGAGVPAAQVHVERFGW
jgi:predicted ferric reductase